ncbi:uncharacterized protein LOC100375334 [Saccoglossus kowalevskii]
MAFPSGTCNMLLLERSAGNERTENCLGKTGEEIVLLSNTTQCATDPKPIVVLLILIPCSVYTNIIHVDLEETREEWPWEFDPPARPAPPDLESPDKKTYEDDGDDDDLYEFRRDVHRRSTYDYGDVLHKSIQFYEAQKSGALPADHRLPWRNDSALYDSGLNGEDLTGGFYDAGDHVKFGFPMAYTTTVLTWGLLRYKDAYEAAGELENMYNIIKWATDYFIKAHPTPNELYMQVGDGRIDHSYWIRPEDMTMERPPFIVNSSNPGSDVAGETAAAFAAASIVFQEVDLAYSTELLAHALDLYSLANNYRGAYTSSYYASSNYGDELAWASAWIYYATENLTWKAEAESMYATYIDSVGNPWSFSWGTKNAGVALLMFEITQNTTYSKKLKSFVNGWLPENEFPHTPLGLAFRSEWGSLRYAAATGMLALFASDSGIRATRFKDWGKQQIDYMLGNSGRSFVVGFGVNSPQSPHHRASSCTEEVFGSTALNSPNVNPHLLVGALVGGPDSQDNYVDNRKDYVKNEVACDYNAAFQSAVAALLHMELTTV